MSVSKQTAKLAIQSLNGKWEVACPKRDVEVTGLVPGEVHRDLLKAKIIPDPFYRDNEKKTQWIGENDWTFSRHFNVSQRLLARKQVILRCHGLDTLATLHINGKKIAKTDNMFRLWEFDIKSKLKAGKNHIQITFASARKFIAAKGRKRRMYGDTFNMGYIRKEHCNFGWDWGLDATTCGIWRDIELVAFDEARIAEVSIQ